MNIRHCVDLSLLARTVDNVRWKGKYTSPIGLARLCETYFQQTLSKGKICRSNWEANLTVAQQMCQYKFFFHRLDRIGLIMSSLDAANDAHSGLSLYLHLSSMLGATLPRPLPGYYSFDFMYGYLYHLSKAEPSKLWQAQNPNYDPGPPPEKKIKPVEGSDKAAPNEGSNSPNRARRRKEGGATLLGFLSGGVRLGAHAVISP